MKISHAKWTKNNSTLQHRVSLAVAISVVYFISEGKRKNFKKTERYINIIPGSPKIRRARRSVEDC
jgi:hypothetical protein